MLKGEAQDLMDSLLEDNDDDQELDEQHIQEMKKLKLQLLAEHGWVYVPSSMRLRQTLTALPNKKATLIILQV